MILFTPQHSELSKIEKHSHKANGLIESPIRDYSRRDVSRRNIRPPRRVSTSSQQHKQSTSPRSRPNSAPIKRFDPTAYIDDLKQKQARIAKTLKPNPVLFGASERRKSSPRESPIRERHRSVERSTSREKYKESNDHSVKRRKIKVVYNSSDGEESGRARARRRYESSR